MEASASSLSSRVHNIAPRFEFDKPIECIIRSEHSRHTSFWTSCLNISKTGMFLHFEEERFIPFLEGDHLICTIDLHAAHFPRPIHLKSRIVRTQSSDTGHPNGYGLEIVEIEDKHQDHFLDTLASLENI